MPHQIVSVQKQQVLLSLVLEVLQAPALTLLHEVLAPYLALRPLNDGVEDVLVRILDVLLDHMLGR